VLERAGGPRVWRGKKTKGVNGKGGDITGGKGVKDLRKKTGVVSKYNWGKKKKKRGRQIITREGFCVPFQKQERSRKGPWDHSNPMGTTAKKYRIWYKKEKKNPGNKGHSPAQARAKTCISVR